MAVETLARPIEERTESHPEVACIHHWLIDPPDGPTSKGTCKKCGATKHFVNHIGFSNWESEALAVRRLAIKDDRGIEEGDD
ncbi:MAG: hypothetical protein FJZ95_09990 [Chloroflexi bacterium]|nr:hypothetical protein [Chloroflexota bacterium]